MNWYQLDIDKVCHKLKSSEAGLTEDEATKRLNLYGPNVLTQEEKVSRFKVLLHQFTSPLIYILLIAAVVTFFLEEYIDTGVIVAVVVLNAVIGYFQEFRAEESIRALKKMIVPRARVLRDGKEMEVNSKVLVPGDIVFLSSGGKIPADLRLLKTIEVKTDEALLTGESLPVEKSINSIPEKDLTPGDQKNMAFMGTVVVSGRARGVVVETGADTVLGQIAEEVREVQAFRTPLQEKLDRFARLIGIIVVAFSIAMMVIGALMGEKLSEMFMVAVATAVSAIPEGLPIAVTIAMSIGVARMARRNSIIRKLPAVETLGSTTVIGSDKTGTLTKNEMTVTLLYDGEHVYEMTGSGYEPEGEILLDKMPLGGDQLKKVQQMLRVGLLCNESRLYEEEGRFKVDGDPTEGALIVAALKGSLNLEEEKEKHPVIALLPFESDRGYMATLHNVEGKKIVFIKGSLDRMLDICTECMIDDIPRRNAWIEKAEAFARKGLRVLGMAWKEVPPETEEVTHQDIESDLTFAGIQGMIDPERPEVLMAIRGCKEAGIRTVMITGDHAITAHAIGEKLGIIDGNSTVLTGKEIARMSEEELFEKVQTISIYARVSPQHKLMIVQQLVKHGEVVSVTGDGVNDAPALKAAHIGVAMGKEGTDVAKEASDMILTDDNFASIFGAVEEGRIVYDNIKKVTLFLVSCGFGELITILVTILMGLPLPYIPAQILWLNLVTNGFQDVALAFEPGEEGILKRKPRPIKEGILSTLMVQRTLLMGTILAIGTLYIFIERLNAGVSVEGARTAALTTMVFFQFFQAYNCRSETQSIFKMGLRSNPFLLFSIMAALFAQLAVIYVPALQWIFRTEAISMTGWIDIIAVSLSIVIAVEIDKWMRRKKEEI